MAADSRVVEAVSRGVGGGIAAGPCWPITVIAATNRPTTAINTNHGVTNVSLSYDYLARLVACRIVRCGLQTELDAVCVTVYATPPTFRSRCT